MTLSVQTEDRISSNSSQPVTLEISESEALEISTAAAELRHLDPVTQALEYIIEAKVTAARAVPERLRRAVTEFRYASPPSAALLFRGMSVGPLPPTPIATARPSGIYLPEADALSLMVSLLGDQFGMCGESDGRIVHDIAAIKGHEVEQSSTSCEVDLKSHNEAAFSSRRPDHVALMCLRSDRDGSAGTVLSTIDRVLEVLEPTAVEMLRLPQFRTSVDISIAGTPDDRVYVGPIAVLLGSEARPRLRCDLGETEGLTGDAQAALDALNEAVQQVRVEVMLGAGDLLMIDNHRALHGRMRFAPRHDGFDRWLLRSFVSRDIVANFDACVSGCTIDFREN